MDAKYRHRTLMLKIYFFYQNFYARCHFLPHITNVDEKGVEKEMIEQNGYEPDRKYAGHIVPHYNHALFLNFVRYLPCMWKFARNPFASLVHQMVMPHCNSLLNWVDQNVRIAYLETPVAPHILATNNQFAVLHEPNGQQEKNFQALRKYAGGKSRYMLHGTRPEAWNSILSWGLIPVQDDYYIEGAPEKQIYVSDTLLGPLKLYSSCARNKLTTSCHLGANCCYQFEKSKFVALCEFVEHADYLEQDFRRATKKIQDEYIVKGHNAIIVRMVLVFDPNAEQEFMLSRNQDLGDMHSEGSISKRSRLPTTPAIPPVSKNEKTWPCTLN